MKKIPPAHSKKKVNEAGESLPKLLINPAEWVEQGDAYDILNNWRAAHNYPLNTFQANIRTKIRRGGFKGAIVAQRLKRAPSILDKLRREKHMKLSTMQDIGGIRAILPTLHQTKKIAQGFRESYFSHELIKEYDYIEYPKESGYRSIHFVYRYKNRRAPEYEGLRIELQIRSQLQHSWATAVEVVGAFLNTSLKSSEGPDKWLEFFAMVGSGFALMEGCKPHDRFMSVPPRDLVRKIASMEKALSITQSLNAFGATVRAIDFKRHNYKYYILHMKPAEMSVSYLGFQEGQLDVATSKYLELEQKIQDGNAEQVVLVSGVNFQELQRAYPNYFLDSKIFLQNIVSLKKHFL